MEQYQDLFPENLSPAGEGEGAGVEAEDVSAAPEGATAPSEPSAAADLEALQQRLAELEKRYEAVKWAEPLANLIYTDPERAKQAFNQVIELAQTVQPIAGTREEIPAATSDALQQIAQLVQNPPEELNWADPLTQTLWQGLVALYQEAKSLREQLMNVNNVNNQLMQELYLAAIEETFDELEQKYGKFDRNEVMRVMVERNIADPEDAFKLVYFGRVNPPSPKTTSPVTRVTNLPTRGTPSSRVTASKPSSLADLVNAVLDEYGFK